MGAVTPEERPAWWLLKRGGETPIVVDISGAYATGDLLFDRVKIPNAALNGRASLTFASF